MGRGNTCVFNDYEGLYFVDKDNFRYECEDGEEEFINYDVEQEDFEIFLETLKADLMRKFSSLYEADEWINHYEDRAFLENGLFYITITDNEWSFAIKLIQKEQEYLERGNLENLQKNLYQNYLKGIRECLFLQLDEIGIYGGPYTSGRIKREDEEAVA